MASAIARSIAFCADPIKRRASVSWSNSVDPLVCGSSSFSIVDRSSTAVPQNDKRDGFVHLSSEAF
eukprot:CAMPEP_0195579222 /NCGR_PEP_ID=MMETSP0814-20130614/14067_1 /TAXON_ID=97485 /ORGANISM="Prymnesium parvum, Strain Texoma1" /LENGTH=65 /DNA_ID=CAMNT_0040715933 /DNA_START=232 /DNA_END=429 /DNA_ORIENTATION=-